MDRPAIDQVLAVAGVAGFGAAIGVHLAVGYTDLILSGRRSWVR